MAHGERAARPCPRQRVAPTIGAGRPHPLGVTAVRILFGTDGSDAACRALEQLVASFVLPATTVVEVLAVEPADFGSGVGADGIAAANIAVALRRLAAEGINGTGLVAFGDPATELIARAEATSPDLVVLGADRGGATGPHPLASSIGHVAATVALEGHASVLVSTGGGGIRRIVLGSDGSSEAERAMALLCGMPFRGQPEVVVVSVADRPAERSGGLLAEGGSIGSSSREAVEVARAIADEAADRLRGSAVRTLVRTPVGPAAEQLPVIAKEVAADLVVVGTRGLGALQRRRVGSVTAGLLGRMPTSILIARAAPEPP